MQQLRGINWQSFDYYPCLQKLRVYAQEHYTQDLSLQTASRVVGMESTYFSSFFRRKVGLCYTDWVSYLRVSQAMLLLSERDRSITATAHAVGFVDLRTFERAFKKVTNATAREYKQWVRPA